MGLTPQLLAQPSRLLARGDDRLREGIREGVRSEREPPAFSNYYMHGVDIEIHNRKNFQGGGIASPQSPP